MSVPQNIPGKGQVLKYVLEVPGSDPIANPVFTYLLTNVLHIGPITNMHDLCTSFLEHVLHVRHFTLNITLNYLSIQ